jgi:hypothetical protein
MGAKRKKTSEKQVLDILGRYPSISEIRLGSTYEVVLNGKPIQFEFLPTNMLLDLIDVIDFAYDRD